MDTVTLASGLETPWEIIYASDSNILFTERIGKVSRLNPKNGDIHLLLDIRHKVEQTGESGLLGMDVIFDVAVPKIFLVYTYKDSMSNLFERLVRCDYDVFHDSIFGEMIIQDSIPAAANHNGSRLKVIGDYIFMTTGDAQTLSYPQDLSKLSGKILRFHLNGSVPSDNPIAGSPIYSWGHRNPQGLLSANGFLYSSEHGASTDDEINIIEKGKNYGWPKVEGYCNTPSEQAFCNDSNVVEPIYNWTPTIATSDLIYYDHPAIPEFQSSLLMTTLKNERLHQLKLNTSKDSILSTADYFPSYWGRLRDICSNEKGEIFLATNSGSHSIVKLYNAAYTGIISPNIDHEVRIYPNPNTSTLQIDLGSSFGNTDILLYNPEGKLVREIHSNLKTIYIEKNELSPGIYLLEIISNNKRSTQKVLFQ